MSKIFRRSSCQKASDGTDRAHRLRYRTRFGKGLGLPLSAVHGPPDAERLTQGVSVAPTVAIVDSQSVKTTEAGGPRGYDAGKKTKGRKRHLAVDTVGLPIKCHVTPADVQDRHALPALLKAVSQKSPWIELAFVDGGYAGGETQRAAFEASRIKISVVKRSDRTVEGFVVLPKRWIVERTLGWLNRARRLAKDFEATIKSSRAWLMLALGFLLVRRIGRDYQTSG